MRRKRFWAVCYGHVCRWSQADTPRAAVLDAFGIKITAFDTDRITVWEFPGNPKYIAIYQRNEFLEALFKRHQEKTGSVIK